MRVDRPPDASGQAVQVMIAHAADATGADFTQLLETARRESGLKPDAAAATSSARGLFQFIESTWLDMVARHGAAHGMADAAARITLRDGKPHVSDPRERAAILALRFEPEPAARMAGELTKENTAALERRLSRAPTVGEVYAAHVLGPEGAVRLIEGAASGAASAAALLPQAAAANRSIFYAEDGAARTPAAVLERLAGEGGSAGAPSSREGASLLLAQAQDAFGAGWAGGLEDDLWALALKAYGETRTA